MVIEKCRRSRWRYLCTHTVVVDKSRYLSCTHACLCMICRLIFCRTVWIVTTNTSPVVGCTLQHFLQLKPTAAYQFALVHFVIRRYLPVLTEAISHALLLSCLKRSQIKVCAKACCG
jgi:hypothetical protein